MEKNKLSGNDEKFAFSLFLSSNLIFALILFAAYFSNISFKIQKESAIIIFSLFIVFQFLSLNILLYKNYNFGSILYIIGSFLGVFVFDRIDTQLYGITKMFFLLPITLGILFIKIHKKFVFVLSSLIVTLLSFSVNYILLAKIILSILLILFLYSLIIIRNWFENTEKIRSDSLKKVNYITLKILGKVSEIKDTDTLDHLTRVELIIEILANKIKNNKAYSEYLTESYIEDLKAAAYLHDIGKIGITDSILLKPGKLTENEFSIIQTHTLIGYEILKDAMEEIENQSLYDLALVIARHHHEKWDGTGYPDKLKGIDIPFSARLMSIVDVYDALISRRPYKDSISHDKAVEIIKKGSGTHFDPQIVNHFISSSNMIKEKLKLYPD